MKLKAGKQGVDAIDVGMQQPSIITICTDGDAAVPDEQPSTPVIWCLPPRGLKPAQAGEEIHIGDSETHLPYRKTLKLYRDSGLRTQFPTSKSSPNSGKTGTNPLKLGPNVGPHSPNSSAHFPFLSRQSPLLRRTVRNLGSRQCENGGATRTCTEK